MPTIRVKENEPLDAALRRFKRMCEKAGILTEVRRRETYEKPTTIRKRRKAAAVKRALKKTLRDDPRLAKMNGRRRVAKTPTTTRTTREKH